MFIVYTRKFEYFEFPALFLPFVYLSQSAGNCKLADKQKTTKVREIQITKILKVSMYHIFCALI